MMIQSDPSECPRKRERFPTKRISGRKRLVFRLVALFLAFLLALALGEIIVRVVAPQDLIGTLFDVGRNGLVVHRRNHQCRHQRGDRVVEYVFDAKGLRITPGSIPSAEFRVLCVGDSFTFGWLLKSRDTYLAHLQRAINDEFGDGRIALLNGGHGGWGTADYVSYVLHYGEEIAPDVIVVFISHDDIGRSIQKRRFVFEGDGAPKLRERKIMVSSRSKLKTALKSNPLSNWLFERSHLLGFVRTAVRPSSRRRLEPGRTESEEARRLGSELFRLLSHWCQENRSRLYVLTTGLHARKGGSFSLDTEPTRVFLSVAAETFAQLGVPFHDCGPNFMKSSMANTRASLSRMTGISTSKEQGSWPISIGRSFPVG